MFLKKIYTPDLEDVEWKKKKTQVKCLVHNFYIDYMVK